MAVSKKDDEAKIVDVAKPGKASPDASSRPIIVTHKPMVKDPMVAESSDAQKTAPPLSSRGKTIIPISQGSSTEKKTEPGTKLAEPKAITISEQAAKLTEPVSPKTPEPEATKEAPPEEEKTEKSTETSNSNSQTHKATESETDEASKGAPVEDKKKQQEEAEARARQEHYNKLVEDKTYFVHIDQTKARKSGGKLLMLLLVLLLLAALVAVGLVDAEIIKTDIELPFDLIQK